METIANYPDIISAQMASAMLAAEGIDASIPDENMIGIDWRMATALQGIRLQVAPDDAERARELLAHAGEESEPDAVEIEEPVAGEDVCPRCQSSSIGPARWRTRLKAATMLMPTLLLVWPFVMAIKPRIRCSACGYKWRGADSSVPPSPR